MDATDAIRSLRAWRLHGGLFLLLTAGVLLSHYAIVVDLVSIWWRSPTFNHCFLIPLLSGWLIWQRRTDLATQTPEVSWLGALVFAGVSILMIAASLMQVAAAQHFALVLLLQTLVWTLFGERLTWRLLFPVLYLWFAVPFGEFLVPDLQDLTAVMSVGLLKLWGLPVFVEARYIQVPSGSFQVAEACSGINYLIASFALGALYAHLQYHRVSRRAIFIFLSLLVPLIANGLRAFGIILIAHYSDMKYAVGVDHLIYGWLFFGVVMALLFWVGRFLHDTPLPADHKPFSPASLRTPIPVALGVLALALVAPLWLLRTPTLDENDTHAFVAKEGWQRSSEAPRFGTAFEHPWQQQVFQYTASQGRLEAVVAHYPVETPDSELVRSTHLLYDKDRAARIGTEQLSLAGQTLIVERLRDARGEEYFALKLYLLPDAMLGNDIQTKVQQALARLRGRQGSGLAVAVFVPAADFAAQRTELDALLNALQAQLRQREDLQ